MKLLLDTHAFLWFVWNDPRLSSSARVAMEESSNDLFLSATSIWEIAIKVGIGKLSLGQETGGFLDDQLTRNQIDLLPILVPHVARVAILPPVHKDPFDRLLIAQSLVESAPLVSNESLFDSYGVQRIW